MVSAQLVLRLRSMNQFVLLNKAGNVSFGSGFRYKSDNVSEKKVAFQRTKEKQLIVLQGSKSKEKYS